MLHSDYKRTLEEIIDIYIYEPTIRDIYVEGIRDKAFFEWFIDELDIDNLSVKLIENLIIPSKIESKFEVDTNSNKKNKILLMAHELEIRQPTLENARFLADKDFDDFLLKKYKCKFLLYTDYTCMEMYLFNPEILKNFFRWQLKKLPKSPEKILQEFTNILEKVFLIRLARILLDFDFIIKDFSVYLNIASNNLVFDSQKMIKTLLKNQAEKIKLLNRKLIELEQKLTMEPRNQMYKWDFVCLLKFYYHKQGEHVRKRSDQAILDSLYQNLKIDYIRDEQLFKIILDWCNQ